MTGSWRPSLFTLVQFVERTLQLFKLLSSLTQLALRRETLVVREIFGGMRDERVEILPGLR